MSTGGRSCRSGAMAEESRGKLLEVKPGTGHTRQKKNIAPMLPLFHSVQTSPAVRALSNAALRRPETRSTR